jgi:hypothetical protein
VPPTLPPWITRITALGSLALAACAPLSLPQEAPPPKGPPLSSSAEWRAKLARVHGTPTEHEFTAFQAEVRAACPSGPSSALSQGARAYALEPRRATCIYQSMPLLKQEIDALHKILRETPIGDPLRPKILERIASAAFVLEYHTHRSCEDLARVKPIDNRQLRGLREALAYDVHTIAWARSESSAACDALARLANASTKLACPEFLLPPKSPPPPACLEAPMTARFPEEPALTCSSPNR